MPCKLDKGLPGGQNETLSFGPLKAQKGDVAEWLKAAVC